MDYNVIKGDHSQLSLLVSPKQLLAQMIGFTLNVVIGSMLDAFIGYSLRLRVVRASVLYRLRYHTRVNLG